MMKHILSKGPFLYNTSSTLIVVPTDPGFVGMTISKMVKHFTILIIVIPKNHFEVVLDENGKKVPLKESVLSFSVPSYIYKGTAQLWA